MRPDAPFLASSFGSACRPLSATLHLLSVGVQLRNLLRVRLYLCAHCPKLFPKGVVVARRHLELRTHVLGHLLLHCNNLTLIPLKLLCLCVF